MRWAALVAMLVLAGCSSGGGEAATTTTAGVELVLTVHALGGGVTWTGDCQVGEVRVTVADGSGTTLAIESVPMSGEPGEPFRDCTTDPAAVTVPVSEVYRLTVAGAGPLGAPWSASGEFRRDEVESGLVVTARSPLASEIAAA